MAKKPIRPVGRRRDPIDVMNGLTEEEADSGGYNTDGSSKIHRPISKLKLPEVTKMKDKKKKIKIKKKTLFDIIDFED